MTSIKVYWWRPGGRSGRINLGDEINGRIVEYATGRPVERAPLADCDLLAIGSVLNFPVKYKIFETRTAPIHVWGSGMMAPHKLPSRRTNYVYHAVRGLLTHCLIEAEADMAFGDPGILAGQVWPAAKEKRHAWGIVAHHSQRDHPEIARIHAATSRSVLIDFTDPDVAGTMRLLSECERIASNGLHGLVLADSYRIPNYWFDSGVDLHGGKHWKFYDYFSSIGRSRFVPLPIASLSDLERIEPVAADTIHFANVDAAQAALLASRPTF